MVWKIDSFCTLINNIFFYQKKLHRVALMILQKNWKKNAILHFLHSLRSPMVSLSLTTTALTLGSSPFRWPQSQYIHISPIVPSSQVTDVLFCQWVSVVRNISISIFYSLQKNEVLVLLEELDSRTFECQVGNAKGTVQKTHMKIITPLTNLPSNPVPQVIKIEVEWLW